MSTSKRPLARLPKAHLHLHFEGAMRPSTLAELCERDGRRLPEVGTVMGTFAAFQERYVAARSSLATPTDLARLVDEIVEDNRSDGAVWVEIGVNVWDHSRIGSPREVLELLIEAGRNASDRTGVGVGWMVTADRTASPETAVEQAELATAVGPGQHVVALGLANDEAASAPEQFGEAFAVAGSAGLLRTPHAGEHRGPESVRAAVEVLGANRIQHGVRAIEDPSVVELLATEQICLDVCPTSNVCLSVVPEVAEHPLPDLLGSGVPCSINADDPLLFGPGLLAEYELCRNDLGMTDVDLAGCARASILHSAAPEALKATALSGIEAWLAMDE